MVVSSFAVESDPSYSIESSPGVEPDGVGIVQGLRGRS